MGNAFDRFSEINMQRANRWHNGAIRNWTASDWAVAVGGEAGELLNAVKKFRRVEDRIQGADGDTPQPQDREAAVKAIAKEIGDVFAYLDILARFFGLRTWDCVRDTFNAISVREGMPERIPGGFGPDLPAALLRIRHAAEAIETDRDFRVHSNYVTEGALKEILRAVGASPDNCGQEASRV